MPLLFTLFFTRCDWRRVSHSVGPDQLLWLVTMGRVRLTLVLHTSLHLLRQRLAAHTALTGAQERRINNNQSWCPPLSLMPQPHMVPISPRSTRSVNHLPKGVGGCGGWANFAGKEMRMDLYHPRW